MRGFYRNRRGKSTVNSEVKWTVRLVGILKNGIIENGESWKYELLLFPPLKRKTLSSPSVSTNNLSRVENLQIISNAVELNYSTN